MADLSQVSTADLLKALSDHPEVSGQPKSPSEYQGLGDTRRGTYGFSNEMVEQGALLGYGDEATAGINTGFDTLSRIVHGKAPDISSDYDKELAFRRAQKEEWEKTHPVARVGAPILGSMGVAAPAKGAALVTGAVAPSLRETAIAGGKAGALLGGTAGFGAGEGGFENRVESATEGAALGGAIGAAAAPIVEGVRGAYGAVKAALGLSNPETVASNQVATALARSGKTQGEVADAVERAQGFGVPAVPADTSPSLRRLGRAVETVPGQASDAVTRLLDERQTGQGERVASQFRRALGNDGDLLKTADEIIAARKDAAAPLYKKAYEANAADMNAGQVWNPDLANLSERPAMRRAYARARTIIQNEGGDPTTLGITGFGLKPGDFGSYGQFKNPILQKVPTMQAWDYIKRGLDDILEKYRNPLTGKLQLDEAGRAIAMTKAELVANLDKTNPTYAAARQAFAGHTDLLDALHQGQQFTNGDMDMVARRFNDLSDSEKDMFRIGAMKKVRSDIASLPDGTDVVRRVFGTPDRRARLAMLFKDPKEYEVFSNIMEMERETTRTARMVTGGSPTGRIAAEQSDLITGAIEDGFRGHGPMTMAVNAARRMLTRAKGINEETAQRIASYLFNPDPNAARQTMDPKLIQSIIDASQRRRAVSSAVGRGVGVSAAVNQ